MSTVTKAVDGVFVDGTESGLLGEPVGIELADLVRTHKMGDVLVPALRGVSLKVSPGEFVAIMGPSGCGKSTLLSLLGGLDRPTSGSVTVGSRSLGNLRDRDLAEHRLRVAGTVFQSFNLVQNLTALENVALPMALAGVPRGERRERARRLLEVVGLGERANFRPSRLSGGEQQRVAVARALANRPGLLLADEPTGNLDEESGASVLALLQQLHQAGATIVMVTHDAEVAAVATRRVRMRNGQVVEDSQTSPSPALPAGGEGERRGRRIAASEALRMGVAAVRRRKLRTTLSSIGVAIGIAAMAIILSFAIGVNDSLVGTLKAAGQLQQVTVTSRSDPLNPALHKPMTEAAVATLRKLPHVTDAWGNGSVPASVTYGKHTAPAFVANLSPLSETPPIATKFLAAGHLWSSDSANEAMLSEYSVKQLGLTDTSALGQTIAVRGTSFPVPFDQAPPAPGGSTIHLTVTGVFSSSSNSGQTSVVIAIPYQTWLSFHRANATANKWTGDVFFSAILVADSSGRVDDVAAAAKKDGYTATTTSDFLKGFSQFLTYLATGLGGLAGLALIVACLGIANTMYTAVLERTREIGILKAIGARRADIRNMFLAEAATIGFIGGTAGLLIALAAGGVGNKVLGNVLRGQGIGLDLTLFELTWYLVLGALLLAMAFSALSGLLPSVRASRLDPTTALRHD